MFPPELPHLLKFMIVFSDRNLSKYFSRQKILVNIGGKHSPQAANAGRLRTTFVEKRYFSPLVQGLALLPPLPGPQFKLPGAIGCQLGY